MCGVRHPHSRLGAAAVLGFLVLATLTSAAAYTSTVFDEDDLARRIIQATGPNTTTLVLPSYLILTKALPSVVGPIQLVSVAGGAVISCQTPNFTALTVATLSFSMADLTWASCGTVLFMEQLPYDQVTAGNQSSISIDSCSFRSNRIDPMRVSVFF